MMPVKQVLENLCHKDPRHPLYAQNYGWMEPDEIPPARTGCACDNCHTGRDALAEDLIFWFQRNAMAEDALFELACLPNKTTIDEARTLARSSIMSMNGSLGRWHNPVD